MAKFSFTGWRTVVIKQSFEIEAVTQQQANAILWEQQDNFDLDQEWFDLSTAKIKGTDEDPDFYTDQDDLVERTEEVAE